VTNDDPTAAEPAISRHEALRRIAKALELADYGTVDGDHHKMWVIDQMVRALLGCPLEIVTVPVNGSLPEYSYEKQAVNREYELFTAQHGGNWDEGIAP
jgi:hypothetical protein